MQMELHKTLSPGFFKLNSTVVVTCVLVPLCQLVQSASSVTNVGFYDDSCPNVESTVNSVVTSHVELDATIAAGLLRMHFHDCFVQGCDGSVLVDGPNAEKTAPANAGLRGFEVVNDAKAKLEAECPGIVSCADILALAARDAVEMSGGPSWDVPLGRRDGRVSQASDVQNMPSPTDPIAVLKQKFAVKGLSVQDLVTLNGAHTIGQTDCRFFSYRLYDFGAEGQADPTISSSFVGTLQQQCPRDGDGLNRVAMDRGSQTEFDTSFFKNVRDGFGVLESDQRMMSDSATSSLVRGYAGLISGLLGLRFGQAFASSMVKMSNIGVKTGNNGEIRKVCSSFN